MLTDLEYKVLDAIVHSEYQDGSGDIVIDNPVWTDYLNFDRTLIKSGVFSSLIKKGYIRSFRSGKESTCLITKKGYEEYLKSKPTFPTWR